MLDETVTADEKWWECLALSALDFSMNEIRDVPPEVGSLAESLVTLKLTHNKLADLPAEVCGLPLLKVLDVAFNALTALPEGLGRLSALVSLVATDNQLTSLPPSLCECRELEVLQVRLDENRGGVCDVPPRGQSSSGRAVRVGPRLHREALAHRAVVVVAYPCH